MEYAKAVWPTEFVLKHRIIRILLIAAMLVLFCVWIAYYIAKDNPE